MKSILFALLALAVTACTTAQTRTEWVVDQSDKAAVARLQAVYNECKDFAYRSKVAGSKYSEADIHTSCIQRKGYDFKTVTVSN